MGTYTQDVSAQVRQERSLAFRTLGWGGPVSDIFYRHDGNYVPVAVIDSQFSGYYSAENFPMLDLYLRRVEEDGETAYVPFQKVPVPADATEILLVFTRNDEGEVRVLGYDESFSKFSDKGLLLLNLSLQPVAIQVDEDQRFGLKPGAYHLTNEKDRHATVQMAVFRDDGWKLDFKTRLRTRQGKRYLIILRESPVPGVEKIEPIVVAEDINFLSIMLKSADNSIGTGALPDDAVSYR